MELPRCGDGGGLLSLLLEMQDLLVLVEYVVLFQFSWSLFSMKSQLWKDDVIISIVVVWGICDAWGAGLVGNLNFWQKNDESWVEKTSAIEIL